MRTERFIASRLISGKSHLRGYARPVLYVSVISTALGVAVMLLSVFIARGFQHQIRTKVIGFGSHIQVLPYLENAESGSDAMLVDQEFYRDYKKYPQIKSMQPVAYKPGILQRGQKNDKGNREIQGVLFKGINANYDTSFLRQNLKKGKLIRFSPGGSRDILVSGKMARTLDVTVGDTLSAVMITKKDDGSVTPDFRKFTIAGIYETGLEEFDNEYVFIDLFHIQKANGWGIHAVLDINDTIQGNEVEVGLNVVTTAVKPAWTINGKPYPYGMVRLPLEAAQYTFICSDAEEDLLSDTVYVEISRGLVSQATQAYDTYLKPVYNGRDAWTVKVSNTTGSTEAYAGGFEINLKRWEDLKDTDKWLYKLIGPAFTTKTIVEQQSHIFNWLEMVEMNVKIIVALMLVVAIVNLVSAILVLILERSKMIGLLKSFGARDKMVGKIFFYFTANILVRGLLIGNGLALGVYCLQQYTGLIQLNPETYFVNTVPMQFEWLPFLFINALTIVVCLVSFLLPVMLVSKINPVKAIKIE